MHTVANTLRFGCRLAEAKGALILIHGRGASAEDIAGLTDAFDAPEFAFMAPSAKDGVWYPQRFFAPLEKNGFFTFCCGSAAQQLIGVDG